MRIQQTELRSADNQSLKRMSMRPRHKSLLSGENDGNNAICSVQAGAGGTDAQDWAEMLMRMYLALGRSKRVLRLKYSIRLRGARPVLSPATFRVEGEYAYGLLSAEAGVHRLVRISPFNSGGSRETSFTSFFVSPEIDDDIEIDIEEKDLRV